MANFWGWVAYQIQILVLKKTLKRCSGDQRIGARFQVPGLNLTFMAIWNPIRNSLINRIRQIHSFNKELLMLQMWLSFSLVVVSLPHKLGESISAGFRVKTFSPNDLFSPQHAQENWEINVRLCSIRRETASVPCHWVGSVRIYEIGISLYSPQILQVRLATLSTTYKRSIC